MAVELVLLGAGAEGSLWALKEILPKNEPVWSLKADLETRHGGGADSKYGSRAWPSEVHPEELPSPQAWNRAVPITAWWVLGRLFTKMSNRDLRGLEDRVLEHSGRNALRTQLCTAQASPCTPFLAQQLLFSAHTLFQVQQIAAIEHLLRGEGRPVFLGCGRSHFEAGK